jgi:hypothetical protein
MSSTPKLDDKQLSDIARQGNIAGTVPAPHQPIADRSPAETIDPRAGSRPAAPEASVSPPPAVSDQADGQAAREEWLEKACFRATYRTLQNDAEYAQFEQQLHGVRKEIANLRENLRSSDLKLAAIENSRGYKLLQKCRAFRLLLLPRGGKRERMCAAIRGALHSILHGTSARGKSNDRQLPPTDSPGMISPADGIAPEKNLPSKVPLPEENSSSAAPDNEKSRDSDADWHLGFGEIRFAPATWQGGNDSRSDDRFIKLVILSVVHRAGSTLLQRLCNARKGTLIWGEHGGLLQHYADIYASAAYFSASASEERIAYFQHQEDPNRWIASMTPALDYVQHATVESARTFLNTLYGQYRETHDIIGFKEVRYVRGEIELLRKCYPEASILLLFRNPMNTWNSTPRQWYPSFEAWVAKWKRNAQCFLDLAKHDPHCHLLRYEDLIRREKTVIEMLTDVAKITPEQIAGVMAHKIGSAHWGISETERQTIREYCREPMATLGYLD